MIRRRDFLQPGMLADPYPHYRQVRSREAMIWNRSGRWRPLTKHNDIAQALRDGRLSSAATTPYFNQLFFSGSSPCMREKLRSVAEARAKMLLHIDPPAHTRLRSLAATPSAPTGWYPYLMRRMAERPADLLFVARNMLPGA